jgi:hypothetical protein
MNNQFTFWMPLKKSGTERIKGEEVPIIEGIASTENPDLQNEEVIQKGIDFKPLLESGYINWNHMQGPENIIGEPIEARIVKGPSFWIKGFLYPNVARAQAVIQILEAQENLDSNRRLGWSIEGRVLERIGNKIVKSVVQHVAITHEPVNQETWAELVKSMTTGEAAPLRLQNLDDNMTTLLDLLNPCPKCGFNGRVFQDGGKKAFLHLTKCKGIDEEDAYNFLIKLYKKFH